MADLVTYEGMVAYAKGINEPFAQECKVYPFNDPTRQVLDIKGKTTAIREIKTTGAVDYIGGWPDGVGTAESDYIEYYAPYDRAFSASIDSVKEAQSFIEGAKPTLNGVMETFIKTKLAPEVDTAVLSRFASQIPVGNAHAVTDSGYGVGSSDIFATLTNIERDIANAGYDGEVAVFISATVNASLEQALIGSNILANETVIKRVLTREELAEGFGPLEVEIRARKINNLIIISVPDDRMVGKAYMLNGIDPGQQNGGIIPAKNLSSYFDIKILAIPFDAAFANIRHIVSQVFVPAMIDAVDTAENINLVNQKMFGILTLENCGINQAADGYKANIRCLYGGDIFQIHRDACIMVKSATQAQAVTPVKATCVAAATALSGAKTTTSDVKVVFEEINCSGTVYFVSKTTDSATVDSSETLTVPSSGADRRPYCTPTVTFGNTAGTSVIEVHTGSASGPKIGEFTVTSEG